MFQKFRGRWSPSPRSRVMGSVVDALETRFSAACGTYRANLVTVDQTTRA